MITIEKLKLVVKLNRGMKQYLGLTKNSDYDKYINCRFIVLNIFTVINTIIFLYNFASVNQ